MLGEWQRGKSMPRPAKQSYIEAEVFDDDGSPLSTVVLWVKNILTPDEFGRALQSYVAGAQILTIDGG